MSMPVGGHAVPGWVLSRIPIRARHEAVKLYRAQAICTGVHQRCESRWACIWIGRGDRTACLPRRRAMAAVDALRLIPVRRWDRQGVRLVGNILPPKGKASVHNRLV